MSNAGNPIISPGLAAVEFPSVLDRISGFASSSVGSAHVASLRPTPDVEAARERLLVADEMVSLVLRYEWTPPPIPDLEAVLDRLEIGGSVLGEADLLDISVLLSSSRRARGDLRREPGELSRLAGLAQPLLVSRPFEKRLSGSFNSTGAVADGASRVLERIRADLRGARAGLVKRLEQFAARLPERIRVDDASVTVRAGRYCIPIRREGMSRVGGIVHDESATHQTIFVEPPQAIEEMNRIAGLERAEAREIQRILAELTDMLRPEVEALKGSLRLLAEADSLQARARYALDHGGVRPELLDPGTDDGFEVVDGVHPLLLHGDEPAVPFSLRMLPAERVLLISGPNAGGKTVSLKALGLLAGLAQSGVIPPAGAGTRLPTFDGFFAVIGDEQSISASLSTFSAQMKSVESILRRASPHSLVLLDEIGGNTDPAEGGALAGAILMRLAGEVRLTVATTHLGSLKELAAETPAVVNASLQFDAEALCPSFVLVRDRPGRSYALEIAERLGLPADLVREARARLGGSEQRMDEVLKRLEETETELRRLTSGARAETSVLSRQASRLEERARDLERRERDLVQEERTRVDRYLLDARREVEMEIARLREEAGPAREEAERSARRAVERLLRRNRERTVPETPVADGATAALKDPAPGDPVVARSLGLKGRVLEVRPDQVIVEAGGIRFALDRADIAPRDAPQADRPLGGGGRTPDVEGKPEVDLRGLRADEVAGPLLSAVDAAIVADLGRLLVIHGKGTGALRSAVNSILAGDSRIRSIRSGGFEEGGSGVTVVELKGGTI